MIFSDQIRQAIDRSGLSRYRICKTIGLAESSMSAFMAGKRGLSMDCLDKLVKLLGLVVTSKGNTRKER